MRIRAVWRVAILVLALLIMAFVSTGSSRSRAAVEVSPCTLTLEVSDETGRPLLARARVMPATWAERARLGVWSDIHGLSHEQLALPPGSYQVFVTHGPEWSIAQFGLEAGHGRRVVQRVTLRHEVSLAGYRAADLHVHSAHSDDAHERGGVSGHDLHAEGVELAVGTDHNHIGDLGPGIDSVAGAEVTTWAPEVGHFNAFPLRDLPTFRGTTPRRLLEDLTQDPRVFVQINHPRLEDHIAYFALGGFDGRRFARSEFDVQVHGLEVWNGYDLARPAAVHRLMADWRSLTAGGRRLTATGGSDSHGPRGHYPGYPRTYVRARDAEELAPALRAGQAFVTNGPLLDLKVQGREPGDSLAVHDSTLLWVELTVLAPSWMSVARAELWAGEERVWDTAIPAPEPGQALRFVARVRVPVGQARTLQAVVDGGTGLEALLGRKDVRPLAFTNPVYLTRGAHHQDPKHPR